MRKLIFVLTVVLLFACEKEEKSDPSEPNYPIIEPLPYLPVYPGSYWIYENEDADTVIKRVEDKYATIHPAGFLKDEYVLLPVYDSTLIYKYNRVVLIEPWAGKKELKPILRDTFAGTRFFYDYYPNGDSAYKIVESRDTSILVNSVRYDSVIVVLFYSKGDGLNGSEPYQEFSRWYFAKGVGMIREEYGNHEPKLNLISYHINK